MKTTDIPNIRLHNLHVTNKLSTPTEVVRSLTAVQAQDYLGSLWAVALRTKNATEKDVEKAIENREIVRTWPMRRTIHFCAAEDAKWLVQLMAEKMVNGSKNRAEKMFGINDTLVEKCKDALIKALQGGKSLMRDEVYEVWEKIGVKTGGSTGLHLIVRISQEGLTCFGPRKGKQPTFVLLDEWVKKPRKLNRDEAISELALRYFTSHGPATVNDMKWWTGLTGKEIKDGIESVKSKLESETIDGITYYFKSSNLQPQSSGLHLLAAYDEYILGYINREAVLRDAHKYHLNPGNGVFTPIIVSNGQVVGTWKRTIKKSSVDITPCPFIKLSPADLKDFEKESARYKNFLNL